VLEGDSSGGPGSAAACRPIEESPGLIFRREIAEADEAGEVGNRLTTFPAGRVQQKGRCLRLG